MEFLISNIQHFQIFSGIRSELIVALSQLIPNFGMVIKIGKVLDFAAL